MHQGKPANATHIHSKGKIAVEQHNPYQRPQAQVADVLSPDGLVPASRGKRLAAAIVDGLIALAVFIPIMIYGGYFTALAQG